MMRAIFFISVDGPTEFWLKKKNSLLNSLVTEFLSFSLTPLK